MVRRVGMIIGAIVALLAAGGGGYYLGHSRAMTQARPSRVQLGPGGTMRLVPGQTPQAGQRVERALAGGFVGTIEAVEGTTVVVNTPQGRVRVNTTDTTLIEKMASVGVGELKVGEQVLVTGPRGDDGAYTARSIQALRTPQMAQPNRP